MTNRRVGWGPWVQIGDPNEGPEALRFTSDEPTDEPADEAETADGQQHAPATINQHPVRGDTPALPGVRSGDAASSFARQ